MKGPYATGSRDPTSGWSADLASGTQPPAGWPPHDHQDVLTRLATDEANIATNTASLALINLGAWTTWSPTLTNLTLGNGGLIAKYMKVGRTVHYRMQFQLGSTSSVGTQPTWTLPVTGASDYISEWPTGTTVMIDNGVKAYSGYVQMIGTSFGFIRYDDGAGAFTTVSATVPFTWGTSDYFMLTATYEAAS